MSNFIRITFVVFLLSGCTFANSQSMPYKAWRLGFSAPAYMEVWIETADVVDIQDQVYPRAMSGIAAMQEPPNNTGDPRGWPKRASWGKGKYVTGADLPKQIYVRWQSLVEPQTYQMVIKIPEATRELMRKEEKAFCSFGGEWITGYRKAIGIRLAPGGIAKVWVTGPCMTPIEVATVKAVIDPRGPYEGKSGGEYDPPSDVSKAYVEKFGVPYDSWK
ncbi:DUF2931 family protein [Pseudomonas syringae]|uniref:Uncharacterized protein n=2 Tax=Pseudomonas syringae TaxID=317 RepID=A0A3M5KCN5_PSESX|nr:DUF2931 family protein [Pseudomonas syringae]RMT32823.1 hypothetical protein ALP49_200073 [Pseudomonas syringae pv. solidagae]RMT51885.1 hypothetical protein ALP48_01144 [Pseudomonas syringae pv. solidagae]